MRDLLIKVDSRAAKLKVIVLEFIKQFYEEIEEIANKREENVDDSDDEGINLKSAEFEMHIAKSRKDGNVVKRHFKIEHEEVVDSLACNVGVTVKDCSYDEREEEVYRESDKDVFKTAPGKSREYTKTHYHSGH